MDERRFNEWKRLCAATIMACEEHGGEVEAYSTSRPATENEVAEVERELDLTIPSGFRYVLTHFAASFQIEWKLPESAHPPKLFREIFSGGLGWNLYALKEIEGQRRRWVEVVFPDPSDPYHRVWHRKLAVYVVPNDDLLALDLATAGEAPLVYLSHDDGEGHGYTIGNDFPTAIENWMRVGCVGPEGWQWIPFVSSPTSGIEPDCRNAKLWRKWFGIDRHISRV